MTIVDSPSRVVHDRLGVVFLLPWQQLYLDRGETYAEGRGIGKTFIRTLKVVYEAIKQKEACVILACNALHTSEYHRKLIERFLKDQPGWNYSVTTKRFTLENGSQILLKAPPLEPDAWLEMGIEKLTIIYDLD